MPTKSIPQTSFGELRMRAILRSLLPDSAPIYNHRPRWLRGCELDAHYVAEKLAFEFDGRQHRQFTPEFHKTDADFHRQQERDAFKRVECANRGVVVVTVVFADLKEDILRSRLIEAMIIQAGFAPEVQPNARPKRPRKKRQSPAQVSTAEEKAERQEFTARLQAAMDVRMTAPKTVKPPRVKLTRKERRHQTGVRMRAKAAV